MGSLVWERLGQRIWHIVHPRATWRYILCFGFATFVVFRGLFTSSPLMSSHLPAYTGPYTVGAIDVEVPVEARSIHNATFKDGGHSAFKVSSGRSRGKSLTVVARDRSVHSVLSCNPWSCLIKTTSSVGAETAFDHRPGVCSFCANQQLHNRFAHHLWPLGLSWRYQNPSTCRRAPSWPSSAFIARVRN